MYANSKDEYWHTYNETSYWLRSHPLMIGYSWMPQYVEVSGSISMQTHTYIYGIRPMIRVSVENKFLCTSEDDEMLSYGLRFQDEKKTMSAGENFNLILQPIGLDFDLYSYGYNEIKKDDDDRSYYSIEKNKRLIELIERVEMSQNTQNIKDCEVFKDDTKDGHYYGELLSYLDKSNPKPLLVSTSYKSLDNHNYVSHAMIVNTSIKPEALNNGWYLFL